MMCCTAVKWHLFAKLLDLFKPIPAAAADGCFLCTAVPPAVLAEGWTECGEERHRPHSMLWVMKQANWVNER